MQTWFNTTRSQRTQCRAFTIVELLVTMAIIFILVGTAFYALKVAKRGANRTISANALRQIMTAYNNYTKDNNGRLMPGYLDAATIGTGAGQIDIKARLQNRDVMTAGDTSSYVWRLAPYLDYAWKSLMADYRSGEVETRFDTEFTGGIYGPGTGNNSTDLLIALRPSFGLNSIYVGGDNVHGDTSLNPWSNPTGRIAALRESEVKSPAKLIVFAPTRAIGLPVINNISSIQGYAQLCPPYAAFDKNNQTASQLQWQFIDTSTVPDQIVFTGTGGVGGIPVDRAGEHRVAVGHLDGSVGTETLEGLGPSNLNPNTRMSRWSPFAVGE